MGLTQLEGIFCTVPHFSGQENVGRMAGAEQSSCDHEGILKMDITNDISQLTITALGHLPPELLHITEQQTPILFNAQYFGLLLKAEYNS